MKTQKICILGILTAMFVALAMALRVPVFDNFYLCLGYVAMYIAIYLYDIFGGLIVGTIGTSIYCILISGLRGLPGWIVGNICISVFVGLWMRFTKKHADKFCWIILTELIIVVSTAIGMLIFKSLTEVIIYAQPMWLRITTNFPAFITDSIVLCVSIPICKLLNFKSQTHTTAEE